MDKVVVTKSKLDSLAQHINAKAGTTGAKTIDQMQATVDGITVGGKLQTKTVTGTGTYTPDEGYDGFSQVEVDIQGLNGITDDKLRFGTGLWNGNIEYEGNYVGTYNYTFKDIITPPPTEIISSGKIVLPPFVPCNLIRKITASGSMSSFYDMPFTELRYQATGTDISSFRLFVTYGNNSTLYLIGQWVKQSDGTYKLRQVMDGGFSRTLLFLEPPVLASDTTPLAEWLRDSVNSHCGWGVYTPDMPLSYLSKEEITITKNGTTTVKPVLRHARADGKVTTKTTYSDGFESVTVNVNVPVPAVQDTKALTITSNGTVSVTPDAPYDALKKVDVTVDVASTMAATNIVTFEYTPTDSTLVIPHDVLVGAGIDTEDKFFKIVGISIFPKNGDVDWFYVSYGGALDRTVFSQQLKYLHSMEQSGVLTFYNLSGSLPYQIALSTSSGDDRNAINKTFIVTLLLSE